MKTPPPFPDAAFPDTVVLIRVNTVLIWLPDVLPVLLVTDRALARRVASTVWGFDEQRDEQVTFAGSALVPMHESRVQQAGHGAYRLGEQFSELCTADHVIAAHPLRQVERMMRHDNFHFRRRHIRESSAKFF